MSVSYTECSQGQFSTLYVECIPIAIWFRMNCHGLVGPGYKSRQTLVCSWSFILCIWLSYWSQIKFHSTIIPSLIFTAVLRSIFFPVMPAPLISVLLLTQSCVSINKCNHRQLVRHIFSIAAFLCTSFVRISCIFSATVKCFVSSFQYVHSFLLVPHPQKDKKSHHFIFLPHSVDFKLDDMNDMCVCGVMRCEVLKYFTMVCSQATNPAASVEEIIFSL